MQIIKLSRISKSFGKFSALKSVDFEVEKGSIFGVIGLSGAGKSTLVRILLGLENPTEGDIWFEDRKITPFTKESLRFLRSHLGTVFQHFNLLSSKTALENVGLPLEIQNVSSTIRKKRAVELLKVCGLEGKEDLFPANLSGGEKQRVAIARALVHNPSLLIADEFTSALDPMTTRSILDLLLKLNADLRLTILLITHEMDVIKRICSHAAVLHEGKLVECGKTEDIFAKPIHTITKSLLQNVIHEIPPDLERRGLIHLFFRGSSSGKPLITEVIRKFDVEVNILLGGIDTLRNENVGNLVVELNGKEEEKQKAIHFLEKEGVVCQKL